MARILAPEEQALDSGSAEPKSELLNCSTAQLLNCSTAQLLNCSTAQLLNCSSDEADWADERANCIRGPLIAARDGGCVVGNCNSYCT
jgi:hypothetical protein